MALNTNLVNPNGTTNMFSQTGLMGRLGTLPAYTPVAQLPVNGATAAAPGPNSSRYNSAAYGGTAGTVSGTAMALGAAAEQERRAAAQRNADRAAIIEAGYQQQIGNSRELADQGYQRLNTDYAGVTADAQATRDRNLARVDQYGNSLRSDLDIKNRQALAAASQSAIQRGLGNTTIQDSLVRGQNYDNTRQMMSLEDQLLQNRISTDSNLSKNYQDTLQARAQGLANQWNQNTANENDLTGKRLQFLENIQDEGPSFTDVGNYYLQAAAAQPEPVQAPPVKINTAQIYAQAINKVNRRAGYGGFNFT